LKDHDDIKKKGYGINKQTENRHNAKLSAVTRQFCPQWT